MSKEKIECGLWHIQRYLIQKYGIIASERIIAPLKWYVYTGRASGEFLRKLFEAKPFMVARKLYKGGTYEEVLDRIKDYIGF